MSPSAAHTLLAPRKDPLGRFLIGSAVGHAALVVIGLVVSDGWGSKPIDLDQKPIRASLVRRGKPRDEQLLPRKDEPPPPPKEVPAPEVPVAPAPVPVPAPAAVPVAIPGVKPAEKPPAPKQAGAKTGEDRRKQLFGAFSKTGKASKPQELEGAEDGDVDGDSSTAEGERYYGLLTSQVRRLYDVPNTIPEAERLRLRALVSMTIGRSGEVLAAKLARTSGNGLFDAAVLGAVKKASPFSPPPEHLRASLQRQGITLEFTP